MAVTDAPFRSRRHLAAHLALILFTLVGGLALVPFVAVLFGVLVK
ncbi:hypothetical protein SAMN05660666_03450 [Novosphingobium aromaticivorans]|nr:hypothetical protein SAMN05660666_03450 [Novosphingobium aromaticivorans]